MLAPMWALGAKLASRELGWTWLSATSVRDHNSALWDLLLDSPAAVLRAIRSAAADTYNFHILRKLGRASQ